MLTRVLDGLLGRRKSDVSDAPHPPSVESPHSSGPPERRRSLNSKFRQLNVQIPRRSSRLHPNLRRRLSLPYGLQHRHHRRSSFPLSPSQSSTSSSTTSSTSSASFPPSTRSTVIRDLLLGNVESLRPVLQIQHSTNDDNILVDESGGGGGLCLSPFRGGFEFGDDQGEEEKDADEEEEERGSGSGSSSFSDRDSESSSSSSSAFRDRFCGIGSGSGTHSPHMLGCGNVTRGSGPSRQGWHHRMGQIPRDRRRRGSFSLSRYVLKSNTNTNTKSYTPSPTTTCGGLGRRKSLSVLLSSVAVPGSASISATPYFRRSSLSSRSSSGSSSRSRSRSRSKSKSRSRSRSRSHSRSHSRSRADSSSSGKRFLNPNVTVLKGDSDSSSGSSSLVIHPLGLCVARSASVLGLGVTAEALAESISTFPPRNSMLGLVQLLVGEGLADPNFLMSSGATSAYRPESVVLSDPKLSVRRSLVGLLRRFRVCCRRKNLKRRRKSDQEREDEDDEGRNSQKGANVTVKGGGGGAIRMCVCVRQEEESMGVGGAGLIAMEKEMIDKQWLVTPTTLALWLVAAEIDFRSGPGKECRECGGDLEWKKRARMQVLSHCLAQGGSLRAPYYPFSLVRFLLQTRSFSGEISAPFAKRELLELLFRRSVFDPVTVEDDRQFSAAVRIGFQRFWEQEEAVRRKVADEERSGRVQELLRRDFDPEILSPADDDDFEVNQVGDESVDVTISSSSHPCEDFREFVESVEFLVRVCGFTYVPKKERSHLHLCPRTCHSSSAQVRRSSSTSTASFLVLKDKSRHARSSSFSGKCVDSDCCSVCHSTCSRSGSEDSDQEIDRVFGQCPRLARALRGSTSSGSED